MKLQACGRAAVQTIVGLKNIQIKVMASVATHVKQIKVITYLNVKKVSEK